MGSAMPSLLTVKAIVPAIGAQIEGVDLAQIDDEAFAAIHRALAQHHVAFLRGQRLANESLMAFARRFGEPQAASESSFGKQIGRAHV